MANSIGKRRDGIKDFVGSQLFQADYEVLVTGSQELCVPVVGEDGEEGYVVITFKVPKGSRDGEAYDGYAAADDYALKTRLKKEKAAEAARKKEQKIERDKKRRAEKQNQ